ncbi:MAG: hypothetical protein KGL53_00640 [Elusimicrobia bacterium]|nr:hypothetical protein [Elusimicrobiota bacterium]
MLRRTLTRALLAAVAACALSRPAAALLYAPTFTPSGDVFLSSMTAQSVVYVGGGKYRMYLTSGSYTVVSATSSDQVAWSMESGVRLSTAAGGLDASSITAVGVIASTGTGWRMLYVGIDASGDYRVLSATSTDGLTWGKESGARLADNGGAGAIAWLDPFRASDSLLRLYYTADASGGNLASQYRVQSASSTDGGLNWTAEGTRLSAAVAYAVAATTVTGGDTRLYYTTPLSGSTTASEVLSARASDGLAFSDETGVRLSTGASVSALQGLVVLRSTESFRWRMLTGYTVGGSTRTFVSDAVTWTPLVTAVSPSQAQKGQTGVSFTVSGEVFGSNPAVTFYLQPSTVTTTLATKSDVSLTGAVDLLGAAVGVYDVDVVNADGGASSLPRGFTVTLPPGSVGIVDNLFRPLHGGKASITVTIYDPGDVTLRLYTVSGRLVKTLYSGPMSAGSTTLTWDGRTGEGNLVASGVYLLHARGPALDDVSRIVVIK